MLKQRVADIDFRQEVRQKLSRAEQQTSEQSETISKLRTRIDQLNSENKDWMNQNKNLEQKFKLEREKLNQEKDDFSKANSRLQNNLTQLKHEIRSKELVIQKANDQLKLKLLEKGGKQQIGQMDIMAPAILNETLKYSKTGADTDFNFMIAKSQEDIHKRLSQENNQLKECLRQLQKELFEVVDLKSEIFLKRYRAEYGEGREFETEETLKNEIEQIKEEVFNLPFEESARDIISKFHQNFKKLKDFMQKIDKEVANLGVFNQKEETLDDMSKRLVGVTSIQQLQMLLQNYEALVESQHTLLNTSISKMSKIPAPDEISSTFNRFQVLKESEIDEMRNFLNEHKLIMQQQYKDFDNEKKQFEDMNLRMENEKLKISEDREKIEAEVRKIKELNQQISSQLQIK